MYIFGVRLPSNHRRTGPVSFRGAEVSCPNIFSIACPKIQWFCPNITWFFARIWLFSKFQGGGGLQPPSPPPRTPMLAITPWKNLLCMFYFIFIFLFFKLQVIFESLCLKLIHVVCTLMMIPGADPGFSNRGGAKDSVTQRTSPKHASQSLYGRGLGARLRALEALEF